MADDIRPDIETAVNRMGWKVGSKRELRNLPEHLWEGETVDYLAAGKYAGSVGLLTLTNHRLIFLNDRWGSTQVEDFPVDRISSIQWSTNRTVGKLQVFVSGNKSEIENIQKPAGKAISDALRARISGQVAGATPAATVQPPPPQSPPGGDDLIVKLRELGELRDAGVLDDAEFAAAKAKLLT